MIICPPHPRRSPILHTGRTVRGFRSPGRKLRVFHISCNHQASAAQIQDIPSRQKNRMNHALLLAKATIIPPPMLAGCSGGTSDAIDKIIQSSTTMALTVSGFRDDQVYDLSSISPRITAINGPRAL